LRVPSIKGALRFWWRAINAYLPLDKLKEQEAETFGDAGDNYGKSKVQMKITKSLIYNGRSKENPVPHKNATFAFPCFNAGEKFSLKIYGTKKIFDLFILMSILGGIGKRSRRGFGSFKINKIDGVDFNLSISTQEILNLINGIAENNKFKIDNGNIIRKDTINANYAFVKSIEIGTASLKSYKEALRTIGQSSHDNNSNYTGYAIGKERFSSPVYVSVIIMGNDYWPIITTLNTAFKKQNHNHGVDRSTQFKKDILSGGSR